MRFRLLITAAMALALGACGDRRAGTEVGNPEVLAKVSARFPVYDTTGGVDLLSMRFSFMRMDYAYAAAGGYTGNGGIPDSGTCWNRPGGTLIEFPSEGSVSGLKDTLIPDEAWTRSKIILRVPEGTASLPDSADWRTWSNPRYAKFNLTANGDTLPAVFEMPRGMEIRLGFSEDEMVFWRWDHAVWVVVPFNAGKWAGGLDPAAPWKMRADGYRRRYVLFSPTENAQAWNDLKARLPGAFFCDSVEVR